MRPLDTGTGRFCRVVSCVLRRLGVRAQSGSQLQLQHDLDLSGVCQC